MSISKEEKAEYDKRYREKNRTKLKARYSTDSYRESNRQRAARIRSLESPEERAARLLYLREWRLKNPERQLNYKETACPEKRLNNSLKTKYGLTLSTYKEMLASQSGLCAICLEPPKRRKLAVDHCHSTGKVRALLCGRCNILLGQSRESESILNRAIAYLRSFK